MCSSVPANPSDASSIGTEASAILAALYRFRKTVLGEALNGRDLLQRWLKCRAPHAR